MRNLLFLFLLSFLLFSCAEPKTFTISKNEEIVAKPFGWANENSQKIDTVVYEINAGNAILSVLFSETIIVPLYLTGWEIYEPIRLKKENEIFDTDYNNLFFLILIIFIIFIFLIKTNIFYG